MSGLFRNYDKFVSASVFSSANRLILRQDRWRFNPANLYYDPSHRYTGLPQGHQYTAFSLATISQALVHEAKQFAAIEEAKHESDLNLQLSAQCTREALNFIRSQAWNGEVEVSVALLYSLRNNPLLNDIQELDQLKSHILKNARYLSTQNIVDVVTSLKDHQDTKFWNEFTQIVSAKEFSWGNTQIDYNGWHTVQYEYTDKPYKYGISNTSATLSKYEGGSLGGVKKLFLDLYLYGLTSLYWPFVMREKRVKYLFEERQPDREEFKSALKKIQSSGAQVDDLLKRA